MALGDDELPGVGLLDVRTVREDGPRLIGNIAIEAGLPGLGAPRVTPFSGPSCSSLELEAGLPA